MIFTTYWFLAFTSIVVGMYWIIPRDRGRLWFLAVVCAWFHSKFAGPAGVAPILVLMLITYGAGLSRNRGIHTSAITICVLTLCFYKYTVFLIGALIAPVNADLATQMTAGTGSLLPAAPPLGVSFFVFEFVHYLLEVRRGGTPIRSPLQFILFSIFFPSLVAGPIKRYRDFQSAIEESPDRVRASDLVEGLRRIAVGFFKKVVIADNLTALIDHYQPQFSEIGLFSRWLLLAAISIRILMDFSGYSDIAIGTARLFGIRLPENFNWPYLARSVQDFWQRWHMSLSSWIRDYIYIPLGGNRLGSGRRILNGLAAFSICGLWHGPSWNFLAWGIFHGLGLALNATYRSIPLVGSGLGRIVDRDPLIGHGVTLTFVAFGWLLFFYPIPEAWTMAKLLFGLS